MHAQVQNKPNPAGRGKRKTRRQGGKWGPLDSSTFLPKSSLLLGFLSSATIALAGWAETKIHFVSRPKAHQTDMDGWVGGLGGGSSCCLLESSLDSIIVGSENVRGSERHRSSCLDDRQTAAEGVRAFITLGTRACRKRQFNEKVLSGSNHVEGSSCRDAFFLSPPFLLSQELLPSPIVSVTWRSEDQPSQAGLIAGTVSALLPGLPPIGLLLAAWLVPSE